MNSNNNNSIKEEANIMSMVKPPVSTTTTKTLSSPSPRDVSISSGSENSAFSRIESATSTPKILTHGKFTAFMNWIPMDRDAGYMRSVFKSLMISDNADVVMKEANVSSSPFAKSKPPHNIAYITIPRNSIFDTPQGIMFKEGILSNKYQIVLDCGMEYPKTEWEYRVYPTKSKLVPTRASTAATTSDTVLPQKLPQLGVIRINANEATYEKHVGDHTHSAAPLTRVATTAGTSTAVAGAELITQNNYTDNLSDVSCSDQSHDDEEDVDETDISIILTLEDAIADTGNPPIGLPPRSKDITYAGVVGSASTSNVPSKAPKRRPMWADLSDDTPLTSGEVRDNDNTQIKRNLPASTSKGIDKDKLKSNINEMYDYTLSAVSSKHAACKLAYKNLTKANNGLREAKEELERYRSMMHLIGGSNASSIPHDDQFPEVVAPQEEELELNNVPNIQSNYARNDAAAAAGNVGGDDIPFILDSNSGHVTPVTPILYYHNNMDGTLSPVGPAQPANWMQFNQGNNYCQSEYYNGNGNNLLASPNPTCNPSTPSPHTPVMTPSNITSTSRKSINVNMKDKVKGPPSAGAGQAVEAQEKSQGREKSINDEVTETMVSNIEVSKNEEEAEVQTEAKDENSKNSSLKNMLKDLLIDDNIDNVSSDQLMAMLHKYKKHE